MKHVIFLIISLVLGFIFPNLTIPPSLINTFYSVIGIMFSVGMSLILSINTQNVKNVIAKKDIQKKLTHIMNKYIRNFAIVTIIYVIIACMDNFEPFNFFLLYNEYFFNYSLSVAVIEIISIMYYILNMKSMRDEYCKLEEIIDNEQKR